MKRTLTLFCVMISSLLVGLSVPVQAGPDQRRQDRPIHIHIIGASSEYNAKQTVLKLKERLEEGFDVRVTLTQGPGEAKTLDGLDQVREADLLVLYARRLELQKSDWAPIRAYLESNRPIVGIRTASHAFDRNMPEFDERILGASYQGHKGDKPVTVTVAKGQENHSILEGVSTPWKREWGDLYDNVDFDESTTILLNGDDGRREMPVAWTNEVDGRRVFYTSMGIQEDFRRGKPFLRLMMNGINWSLDGRLKRSSRGKGNGVDTSEPQADDP